MVQQGKLFLELLLVRRRMVCLRYEPAFLEVVNDFLKIIRVRRRMVRVRVTVRLGLGLGLGLG